MRASSPLDEAAPLNTQIFDLYSFSLNDKVSDDKPGDGVPDVKLQKKVGAVEVTIKRYAEGIVSDIIDVVKPRFRCWKMILSNTFADGPAEIS